MEVRGWMAVVFPFLVALAVACGGGGSDGTATPAGTHPDAEPRLREIVDALNRQDISAFHEALTAERREELPMQRLEDALDTVRRLAGEVPKLEIVSIEAKRVNGDDAEVDATLNVVLLESRIAVTDTAILEWEDGDWHLADHFLERALAVLGLSAPGGELPTSSP